MKNILLLVLSIVLISCNDQEAKSTSSQEQSKYPSFDEVIYHLYINYDIKGSLADRDKIQVFKSPEGWEVAERSINQNTFEYDVKSRSVLWSKKNNDFEDLSFKKHEVPYDVSQMKVDLNNTLYNRYTSSLENARYKFENYIYYGYEEWRNDIIELFKSKSPESIKEKFTLAQAYLKNVFNVFEPEKDFDKVKKGLEIMKSIRNEKSFNVYIGDVSNKYANDVTGVYYNNMFLNLGYNKNELKQFFKNGLYNDEDLVHGKSLLSSCPKNTILFTFGDNDTYPLIYLQEIENFRTDVQVVNTSLLYVPSYIAYLRENGVKLKGDHDFYSDDLSGYVIVDANRTEDTNYFSLLTLKTIPKKSTGEKKYAEFPSEIKISTKKTLSIKSSYLTRSELVGLDIIFSNDRPAFFAGSRGFSCLDKGQVTSFGLISGIEKMYVDSVWNNIELKTLQVLTDPKMALSSKFKADARVVNLLSIGYLIQLQRAIYHNNDSLRNAIFDFYNEEFNKEGDPAYFRTNIVVLFNENKLETNWVNATALEIANQLEQDIANLLSKDIDQIKLSDLSKLNRILSHYNRLVHSKLISKTREAKQSKKIKLFLREVIQEKPYFKLIIFSSRDLLRSLNDKN